MSLLKKMFGDRSAPASRLPPASQFPDSDAPQEGPSTRSAPRREVVHVVLRETMRRHGIPSDWIDCRILTVASRSQGPGAHLTLIVKGGQERLLAYVPAFQGSYLEALRKFDPRADDWLLSLSWQFDGVEGLQGAFMPDPGSWSAPPAPVAEEEALEQDLQALFAIRDAALRGELPADFQPTQPSPGQRAS